MLRIFLLYRDDLRRSPYWQKKWARDYRTLMAINNGFRCNDAQRERLMRLIIRAANAYPPRG